MLCHAALSCSLGANQSNDSRRSWTERGRQAHQGLHPGLDGQGRVPGEGYGQASVTSHRWPVGSVVTRSFSTLQGLPLALSGVRRVLEVMDWGDAAPFVSFGSVGAGQVRPAWQTTGQAATGRHCCMLSFSFPVLVASRAVPLPHILCISLLRRWMARMSI